MTGISLPLMRLDDVADTFPALYDLGIRQVELQFVDRDVDRLAQSIGLLHATGFSVMLHIGTPLTEALLKSLALALRGAEQESFVLAVPGICMEDTDTLLACMMAVREQMIPILPALEYHGEAGALDRLDSCGLDGLGICLNWDDVSSYDSLTDKRLKKRLACVRVRNTETMLDAERRVVLSSLSHGYLGGYHVSLFSGGEQACQNKLEAISDIIHNLYGALPLCARLYDDIQLHFDERLDHALSVWEQPRQGIWFSLIHSTAFLFQTNGFRWAMDIAFRNTYRLSRLPSNAATLLKDLELMIISHEHADHFEEKTVRQLAENDTCWIIPDFLVDTALKWGIRRDRIIPAMPGEKIRIGPLTVLPFEGRHYRPVTGKGVRAYGYRITAQDVPSLVFPGDTRNFSLDGLPSIPPSDWCFANVWLGDKNGFCEDYGTMLTDYARFMLQFSRQNVIFAHLYECNRKAEDMWRRVHARTIAEVMHEISPDVKTHIPASGDMMHLI